MEQNKEHQGETNPAVPATNRDKILEAAARIIREEGVVAASLSTIARAADIAKGTLHYYYRSKADLLFDLAERQASKWSRQFLDLAAGAKKGKKNDRALRELITEILVLGNNGILIHLMMEGATGNGELKVKFKNLFSEWSATIQKGLSRLFDLPLSPDNADIILASLIGFLFNSVVSGKNIDPDVFIRFIKDGIAGASRR
ncbi:MAG: TetR/AcrR family transcriptional regulator [Fibrobacter sp.]|nr:TetR/AcrR family transcriptional regulator [Fibrobacter sp.]